MKSSRYRDLTLNGAPLSDAERDGGWHYCADWDFLLIHKSWEEIECCTCDLSKIPKQVKPLSLQDLDDVLRKADPDGHEKGMREAQSWVKSYDIDCFVSEFDADFPRYSEKDYKILDDADALIAELRSLPGITPIEKAKRRAIEILRWTLRVGGKDV